MFQNVTENDKYESETVAGTEPYAEFEGYETCSNCGNGSYVWDDGEKITVCTNCNGVYAKNNAYQMS